MAQTASRGSSEFMRARRASSALRRLLPVSYTHLVKSAALLSTSHPAAFIAPADEPQRTVYFELPYEPGMTVSAELAYEIEAPYCQPHAREVLAEQPTFDTEEMPPHVVFTPYLRALAKEIVGDEMCIRDRPRTEQVMRTVYVETYGKTYTFTKLED